MAAFQGMTRAEDVTLAGGATETLLQLVAATNHRVKLIGWGVSFKGVVVTDEPIKVTLKRQTTVGTSSAGTVVKVDDSIAETLQTTSRISFTAEPTAGDELEVKNVHPQGWYEKFYPEGREVIIGGGDRLGIEVVTPTGVLPDAAAFFHFEE
jgi:hypothetical protein